MRKSYEQLSAEERAYIMLKRLEHKGVGEISRDLSRSASTISREIKRGLVDGKYNASYAGKHSKSLRYNPRTVKKLHPDSVLYQVVHALLKVYCSPEQIAGVLKDMHPGDSRSCVSHETIYSAIYVMPRGELKSELIACLRHGRGTRRPRSGGTDRRGQIPDMTSIHVRPPEVEDRQVAGHWEGDLIKGTANRSSVGTLVERTSGLVLLAKMEDGTAQSAVIGFSTVLQRIEVGMRKTLTYDRGKEMSQHKQLTEQTGMAVYFADPHSPWQRGSNENTNGLLRQYMPKGTDLSLLSQNDLDLIAHSLNTRPRKRHGFKTPIEIYLQISVLERFNDGAIH
ncbi:MAG: IS30 family transposase [Pseudomonadota bacterium]